jgi:hypothetical protein
MSVDSFQRMVRAATAAAFVIALGCQPSRDEIRRDSAVASLGTIMDSPELDVDTVGRSRDTAAALEADQRYLRWMLDHHAELVYLAHQAIDHRDSLSVREEARHLDRTHDAEIAEMRSLLREEYGDTPAPTIRTEHVAMVTPFGRLAGQTYSGAFRSFLVSHHEEAVRMTDSMAPHLTRPRVEAIAKRIREARARDIEALEREVAKQR